MPLASPRPLGDIHIQSLSKDANEDPFGPGPAQGSQPREHRPLSWAPRPHLALFAQLGQRGAGCLVLLLQLAEPGLPVVRLHLHLDKGASQLRAAGLQLLLLPLHLLVQDADSRGGQTQGQGLRSTPRLCPGSAALAKSPPLGASAFPCVSEG